MAKYKVTPEQARNFREHIAWQQDVEPYIKGQLEDVKNRLLYAKLDEVEKLQARHRAFNDLLVVVDNLCKKISDTEEP